MKSLPSTTSMPNPAVRQRKGGYFFLPFFFPFFFFLSFLHSPVHFFPSQYGQRMMKSPIKVKNKRNARIVTSISIYHKLFTIYHDRPKRDSPISTDTKIVTIPYSFPLVLGTPGTSGSFSIASRNARAVALKMASAIWWQFWPW
jgi:hypothetical protein